MFFIIFSSLCCSLAVSEEVSCEPSALGMRDGTIMRDQITASSYHTAQMGYMYLPWRARPSSQGHWRPDNDTLDSWIQVDFSETVIITEIETQGSDNENFQGWISKLQVQSGNSVGTLAYISDPSGSNKIFVANTNYTQFVTVSFPEPISARYLRIVPTECETRCGLEFEVVGCRLVNECEEDTDTCDANADCRDQDNGYECTCKPGFMGNGLKCEDDSSMPSGTETQSKSTPTTFSPNTQKFAGRQMNNNNLTPGITIGAVIGGIFLMVMAVLIIVCLVKRRKKQATSSTNPRLDLDGPYDISVQGTNVALTHPVPNKNITDSKQSFVPNSHDTDDVYHNIQDKEYLYADVDENKYSQENSSSATQEGWMDNTIYATSDDNGEVNQEPAILASVVKCKKNAGKDNNGESGWMDNSIYATSDDDSRPLHNEATEGWADNTIYGD
ncbi:uncharacterized protein [Amphiura filiformis]|uniref:uncharacterized protein n=1 Tax=Amphiura filiformis TaxID=82378 RepID=UPI003B212470